MLLQTPVDIPTPPFCIYPTDQMLFVGSCFAASIGQRLADNQFRVRVNPYGTMYNPASVLHTLQRCLPEQPVPDVAVLTLGTNHVYILKATNEIVDNCEKRPQRLFAEQQLDVSQCADYLRQCVCLLRSASPSVRIILTVSPIRYAKYGFHGSRLSKATLLLAVDELLRSSDDLNTLAYFPAYEILCDELRDYRFYAPDMLHPSEQAADYIFERFAQTFFAPESHRFMAEWQPIRQALAHKPFRPESAEYQTFRSQTLRRLDDFKKKYGLQ